MPAPNFFRRRKPRKARTRAELDEQERQREIEAGKIEAWLERNRVTQCPDGTANGISTHTGLGLTY